MATIIPAWISLIIANSLVMIYKHLPNGIRIWPPKSVSWEDTVGFSGSNLEDNHWWVLISATLDHATLHHFVNNMAMLCMGGYELEEVVGFWSIIIVYFITGAAGWLTTLIVTRFRYREMWDFAAKFQVSVGSSPATYGMATLLVTIAPDVCACTALGVQPWIWISILFFCPPFVSEKYNVQPWVKGSINEGKQIIPVLSINRRSIAYVIAVCLISYYMLRPALSSPTLSCFMFNTNELECSLTAVGALFVYALYTIVLKVSNCLIFGVPLTSRGSDHAAHFGGALIGALIGRLWYLSTPLSWSVWVWLGWLLLRTLTDI